MRMRGLHLMVIGVSLMLTIRPTIADGDRLIGEGRARVVGGSPAALADWPFLGTLRFSDDVTGLSGHVCGGTMITPTWMLTAAHCVAFQQESGKLDGCFPDDMGKVTCGKLQALLKHDDLSLPLEDGLYGIAKIVVHEEFIAVYSAARKDGSAPGRAIEIATQKSGHDIALVQLDRHWNGQLARLSLQPDTDPSEFNSDLRVAGFGYTTGITEQQHMIRYVRQDGAIFFAGSKQLLSTKLPLVATSTCSTRYEKYRAIIGDGQICAGTEAGGHDSCLGDSGGPLVAYDMGDAKYQVGVVSWGVGCASPGWYGIYTRVSVHADWLRGKIGNEASALLTVRIAEIATKGHGDTTPNANSALITAALSQINDVLGAPGGALRITVLGTGLSEKTPRVRLGQRYRFEIRSSVPGRLLVVDIDAVGKVTQIVPNDQMSNVNNRLLASIGVGQTITVPAPNGSWGFPAFQANPPTGKGRLLALVMPERFDYRAVVWSAEQRQRIKGFMPVQPAPYLMNLIDQISTALESHTKTANTIQSEWAWALMEYEIVP